MEQRDFDAAMSKIWTGLEITAEFKYQGIGPDKFEIFQAHIFFFALTLMRIFGK